MSTAIRKSPVESWEDHVEAWHHLGREADGAAWARAAIASSVSTRWGEVSRFAQEVGFTTRSVRYYASTFAAFPESGNRFPLLTFTHHLRAAALASGIEQAKAALELAEREGWSVSALTAYLKPPTAAALPAVAAESCDADGEACGPLTDRDRAFHIAGLVESLTESMKLFEAMKEYDIAPVVEKGTKKSLKELRGKIDNIMGWLTALKQTIDGRVK